MSKMVQIRNLPDNLHRVAKARAAMAGLSLSDYLLAQVKRELEMPSMQEVLDRIKARPVVHPKTSAAEIIRQDRQSH